MTTLAKNLQRLRKENGFTQQSLADEIGIKRSNIGAYEEGRAEPPMQVLITLRDLYGLKTVEQFYSLCEGKAKKSNPLFEKYNSLPDYKKKIVDFIIHN